MLLSRNEYTNSYLLSLYIIVFFPLCPIIFINSISPLPSGIDFFFCVQLFLLSQFHPFHRFFLWLSASIFFSSSRQSRVLLTAIPGKVQIAPSPQEQGVSPFFSSIAQTSCYSLKNNIFFVLKSIIVCFCDEREPYI